MTTIDENVVQVADDSLNGEQCSHSVDLAKREIELEHRQVEMFKRENELNALMRTLESEKVKIQAYEKMLNNHANEINEREIKLLEREQQLKLFESSINSRKVAIEVKESELEKEFALKRKTLQDELVIKNMELERSFADAKQKAHSELLVELENIREAFNVEMASLREKRFATLSDEIEAERKERLGALSSEINTERRLITNETNLLNDRKAELDRRQETLRQQEEKIKNRQADIDFEERRISAREEKLLDREEKISLEVTEQAVDKIKTYEEKLSAKEDELAKLRQQLGLALRNTEALESFQVAFGDDPDVLRERLIQNEEVIKKLKNELANRPSMEVKVDVERLRLEMTKLDAKYHKILEERDSLLKERADSESYELKNRRLMSDNEDLKSQVVELEAKVETYRKRIERLSTVDGRAAERDERIKDIKSAIIKFDTEDGRYSEVGKEQPADELKWLDTIEEKCHKYGIVFPKRILYAYHTALKISDWSPMTVLAGVSGTGKSELPRLYSAFGGINFINVAVQPNWDSQESMLGFFNSIDNKFDAQPLLRFLVQCTEDLKDYVSIALLDEMNLAHVEHYFADFLSKLEERRGKTNKNMPYIDVKLGAGITPFELKMRRNILWTGTMNQDETTKSLSDKVLDRGIVINFPRPTELISRKDMGKLDELRETTLLRYDTWAGTSSKEGWVKRNITFSEEQAKEMYRFKSIVEEINHYLGAVGRAVGHRVWQSIEFYIANYPVVIHNAKESEGALSSELRQAMHRAFEDQIVQKVMPKLRGIDTRGRSKTECLDKIKKLLEDNNFNLTEDFNNACEFGYGQFIWSSANYIGSDVVEIAATEKNSAESGGDKNYEQI